MYVKQNLPWGVTSPGGNEPTSVTMLVNHDDVMINRVTDDVIFRVTGYLCGEFTGLRWIPRTKASDAELW